jgi:hypothetical protein
MVKNKLQAVVSVEKPADVRFCIIDNNGVMMQSFVEKSTVGDNKFNIDFSEMELGQYFVVMVYNDVYRRFCVAKTNYNKIFANKKACRNEFDRLF